MDDVAAVAALDEPTRRRLYEFVVRRTEPVSRDDVATALGLPRATVAFHLDKLVAEDLLAVSFERRTDRAGPGAGRPAKLYRRSERQVTVCLPGRDYELAGHLMAAALESGSSLVARARAMGKQLAEPGCDLPAVLERHGFEPHADDGDLVLRNCPFQALARAYPGVVCGMALALVQGMLAGRGPAHPGYLARQEPLPGGCCVRLVASPPRN
jgi:predicted ArsR family transcriptional regulator